MKSIIIIVFRTVFGYPLHTRKHTQNRSCRSWIANSRNTFTFHVLSLCCDVFYSLAKMMMSLHNIYHNYLLSTHMKVLSANNVSSDKATEEMIQRHHGTSKKSIAGYKFIDQQNFYGILHMLFYAIMCLWFSHLVFILVQYGYYIINCLLKDLFFHYLSLLFPSKMYFS